ncbi:ABC transporter permease [Corynebacterium pelargi]|uniref:Spermidine/putrescine ABC transporter membrane protein n=1 Tax=Corynebacterium pelargi TaxID=1471400 RepID=A0A410W876_9CORY|nr:ABC transporter permease subunit [Corynebacterium pelargi]QAU52160.1 spermidine/putrescine ABC transporter membrane protein [Corynebacterium pelargi]
MKWRAQGINVAGLLAALPFFLFVAAFLVLPIIANINRSLQDASGSYTLDTLGLAMSAENKKAFVLTIQLSVVTAVIGGLIGLIVAWALSSAQGPRWLHSMVRSFSALASQAGGVQLAYAFVALAGTQGLLTTAIRKISPNIADAYTLTSFWGVAVVYLYFQIPLMVVLILPAIGGMKAEWPTAAASLGATKWQYLRDIALPILWPPIAGALLLLFANAFSAYATAYALAGGSLNLVPILIGFMISGNVLLDPGLAAALVTWMMLIIVVAMGLRLLLVKRSSKWLSK